ncbi:large ribosomal subunit protein uL16m [Bacillus rossius redtenbacheri]|uniref:large ribosomal subunit protein uL16m n=1 Tax=Bacillus rossius redtenbacheri TaxID=93214 RepID=UPI002FDD98AA
MTTCLLKLFRLDLCRVGQLGVTKACGLKYFPPPVNYDHVEFPERPRLKIVERMPQFPSNIRPPKMIKNLKFMRGPETLHNTLLHKQYGIIATRGGRMRHGHYEMVRLLIGRRMDMKRMFAIWRIDAPWQPVTKKGLGQRMGGGKGAIDHYVTPIKAGRVIIEVGGKCEFEEVKPMLDLVVGRLPFRAEAVSHQILEEKAEEEERIERENINPYTMKYVIQNNMGGCQNWISRYDRLWFGKYR